MWVWEGQPYHGGLGKVRHGYGVFGKVSMGNACKDDKERYGKNAWRMAAMIWGVGEGHEGLYKVMKGCRTS